MDTNDVQASPPTKKASRLATAFWTILALPIAFISVGNYVQSHHPVGPYKFVLIWLIGTLLGVLGAKIANAIRQAIRPDFVLTSGGFMELLWIKIFWSIGPQIIGLVIGSAVGTDIVSSLLA